MLPANSAFITQHLKRQENKENKIYLKEREILNRVLNSKTSKY
jgi:hypothetical protein